MPKATRQFTDRTEPQAAFQNAYLDMASRMPGENNSQVLTYYGMGGIGKTRLLHELISNLKNKAPFTEQHSNNPLVVYFDFEDAQDGLQVLLHLRNLLSSDPYKWQFPRFELGLHLYKKSIGEDAPEREIKGYLEKAPLMKIFVDIFAEIPLIGPFFKVLSLMDQGQAAVRGLLKQHADIAQMFENMTPQEQRQALPGLFAADLNVYTEKARTPLVVLLDTYECISESPSVHGTALNRDLWLHGEDRLIPMTKNTLWVIAGRHKIPWSIPNTPIEQHLLGSLSKEDAGAFLASAGIPRHLIPDLCKLTDGTPLYLDVCVDHYEQLMERGEEPDISKFGSGDPARLIECYLKYMTPSVRELVYMLTFIPLWDENLVRAAAKEVLDGFSLADFKRVKKLSVTIAVDDKRYFIHRAVAEVLRKYEDNESGEKTAAFLIRHYSQVLKATSPYKDEYSDALTGIMQSALLLYKDRTALAEFYRENIEKPLNLLRTCRRYDRVKQIVTLYWERAAEEPTDYLYAAALSEKAWRAYQCNETKDPFAKQTALKSTLEALRLLHDLQMDTHIETFRALEAMAVFLDKLHGRYTAAVALYQYVIDGCQRFCPDRTNVRFNTKRNLALTHTSAKNYAAADVLFRELMDEAKQLYNEDDRNRLRAIQDLASSARNLGHYQEALEKGNEALQLKRQYLTENHPDTINALVGLSATHYKMGNYEEEASAREEILRIRRKYLSKKHPDITTAIISLANAYKLLPDFQKELPLREEALERVRSEYSDVHNQTLFAVENLAAVYQKIQPDKAEKLYDYWSDLWSTTNQFAYIYIDRLADFVRKELQDYPAAARLYEKALPLRTRNTAYLKKRLAECYLHCDKPEQALELMKSRLPSSHADQETYLQYLSEYIDMLHATGNHDQAEACTQMLSERDRQYIRQYDQYLAQQAELHPRTSPVTPSPVVHKDASYEGLTLPEVIEKLDALITNRPTVSTNSTSQMSLKELMDMVRKQQNQQTQTPSAE